MDVAIVVALIAAGAGLGAAGLGALVAANATRDAARLAQAESRADRDEARQARFAERKLVLTVDLLLAADLHRREADQQVASKWERWEEELEYGPLEGDAPPIPPVGPTEPVRAAYLALDLVAPSAAGPAGELYMATVPLGGLAATWRDPSAGRRGEREVDTNEWSKNWTAAINRWEEARVAFVDAVRADLGVAP